MPSRTLAQPTLMVRFPSRGVDHAAVGISAVEEAMGRAVMIGGVFLLSRDPEALADWYRRHLGWELAFLPDEGYYTELYFREDDDPEQRQHFGLRDHARRARQRRRAHHQLPRRDIEVVVSSLLEDGIETSPITVGPDAEGEGKFARLRDPEGHRIELWEHL